MNDLEYRRRIYINPHDQSEEILAKQSTDETASRFGEEMIRFDTLLENTINIDPPDNFAERILERNIDSSEQDKRQPGFGFKAVTALAASILLMLTFMLSGGLRADDIEKSVMQHVYEELAYLDFEQAFPAASTRAVVKLVGSTLSHDLKNVKYAGLCQIRQSTSVHMLLDGEIGMVTVFLLPKISITRTIAIDDSRFHGLIVSHGPGSIAIIGEKGEPILNTLNDLTESLNWQT